MIECEIVVLTNNIAKPFQDFHKKFRLDFIESNKLLITKSLAEHGLGFLINIYEIEDESQNRKLIKKVIFDTGGLNLTFLYNLHVMEYQINDIDTIILSHWHYDHTGGLHRILLQNQKEIPILCHESAKFERFFIKSDDVKSSDIDGKSKEDVNPFVMQSKLISQKPINIGDLSDLNGSVMFLNRSSKILNLSDLKITLSGEIPRKHEDEDFSNFFSIQNKNILEIDKILDDKCLILEFKNNIILINGCCHSGLKNTLDYVKSISNKTISHIIGGFHMVNASDYRINNTIEYLANFQQKENDLFLFPMHCTGDRFLNNFLLKNRDQEKETRISAFNVSVGTKFIFQSEI
ncbi:MAG: MBL fold metallo-hydrolase [Candidatus Lokiarchaeota archaeon]|nr:MBL fold metallo-hydrolase [Candidatus Lokiarchaeota archaeon]